ncbi:T9SS type A sorting domain-containing protein [Hymenobacter algoricola]
MNHLFRTAALGAVLLFSAAPLSHAQTLDPAFPVTDVYQPATVRALLRQADGRYVVSGNFIQANGVASPRMVRLNADGTLDQSFTTLAAVQTAPVGLRQLPSGRLLLLGSGTLSVAGQSFRNLVQLNADGSLGPALATGTGSSGLAKVVRVQPDGKILLGGTFTAFNGVASPSFVRLNADGSVDTQFAANLGSGFTGEVTTMLVQPDGKIVAGGRFQNFNGTGRRMLVRLNADGSYDGSFTPVVNGPAYAYVAHLGLDPRTNNLIIEGSGLQTPAGNFQFLQRLTTTGTYDPQFNPASGQATCFATDYSGNDQLLVDDQGRVLLGSCFENYYGAPAPVNSSLVRLLPTGTLDPSFAPGPNLLGTINSLVLQPDGSVVVAGNLKNAFATIGTSLVRLTSSAQPDLTFRADLLAAGYVNTLLSQPDGKLLVAGRFTSVSGQPAGNLLRLNPDGSRDAAFAAAGPDYTVESLALQTDGKILVGGRFRKVAGNAAPLLARLQPGGQFDPTFSTGFIPNGTGSTVSALAVQPDGSVLVGGTTLSFTGTFGTALHRLLPTGQTDQTYEANLTASPVKQEQVLSLALLPDGRLYSSSFFYATNPTPGPVLVRRNLDGTLDPSFTVPTVASGAWVQQVLPLAGGKVLAAGSFASYNGAARMDLARLNADGSVDASFDAGLTAGATLSQVTVQPNGRLLLSSSLSLRVGGVSKGPLVRLLPDGGLDNTFGAGPALVTGAVYSTLVQADGGIVVGGQFSQVDGQPRLSLARLTAPQVLAAAPSALADATTEAWPNPAHDVLHLRLNPALRPQQVALLDLTGRIVREQKHLSATADVPVQHLPAGLYLLRVTCADGPVTRRIVVE